MFKPLFYLTDHIINVLCVLILFGGLIVGEEEFTFQHLETDEDVAQHLELMRSVFEHERADLLVEKWISHHPWMSLKDFFVIKHRGKIVAALNLIPSMWSIGGIPLKTAELACVATLPGYRHQGLQRRLMSEYHKQLSEQGYDISAIEGIPFYYRQFGYEYALPLNEQTKIKLDQVPDYESKHVIHPLASKDVPTAMNLLSQAAQKFYVRNTLDKDMWKMRMETRMLAEYKFEIYAVEEDGKVTAYFLDQAIQCRVSVCQLTKLL